MRKSYWKALVLSAAVLIGSTGFGASAAEEKRLEGNGVEARFEEDAGKVSLYRYQEDGSAVQMSEPSWISYPAVNGDPLSDFTDFVCTVEKDVNGTAGKGSRMTVTSHSPSTGLTRICVLESVNDVPGLLYVKTSYRAGDVQAAVQKFVDCEFALADPAQTVWSYNGGGEGSQSYYDTLQKIDLTDSAVFRRDNRQDYTSVGIPVADIYSENGGISVGDASVTRREVWTPVYEGDGTVSAGIRRPAQAVGGQKTVEAGQGFVYVHGGDYYAGLRGYADGMRKLGFETLSPEEIPESSYDLRWESWGWEFDWTLDKILGKLDELQEIGIKQVTLDDGWYNHAGEWGLNTEKLLNGSADMKRLTDAIHERGMTALLWWRPCDGGREGSRLYKEHPEYFVKNENGSFGKLAGPGAYDGFNGSTGYALCPMSEGAVQSQADFVKTAMKEWGFDGLKSDYVWSLPKCYNPEHHHDRPEESTENQAVFYREVYKAMKECDENAFHLLCNCGTPQDYYSLPYVTQIPTADPTSVDQTRRRVKAYKALCGDYFPVTTDHNELWYPSSVGTGAVLIEKRNMTGSQQADYERWLKIAQREELQKGKFIGDLYSYGFDPYETYVVEKDGTMYYGFYRDGAKYRPQGNPDIELKGLNPDRLYRIVDYVNDEVVATNVPGGQAVFSKNFTSYLLLKAEEIPRPDPLPVTAEETKIEESDSRLVYEGNWTAEQNNVFSGGGSKYTTAVSASVSLTFRGDSIAWYGQKDTNFGGAQVYIDGILDREISCNGAAVTGEKLYEKTGLAAGEHTIRIVCKTPVIDIDFLLYTEKHVGNGEFAETVSSFASACPVAGFTEGTQAFETAKARLEELLSGGNAEPEMLNQAEEQLWDALLGLRREVKRELIGAKAQLPQGTESSGKDIRDLYRVIAYAEKLDVQNVIPAVRTPYMSALSQAREVFRNAEADQNEINQAWAELLDKIQHTGYTQGNKTELGVILAEYRQLDTAKYENPQAFAAALSDAERLMKDENALDYEILSVVAALKSERQKLVLKKTDGNNQGGNNLGDKKPDDENPPAAGDEKKIGNGRYQILDPNRKTAVLVSVVNKNAAKMNIPAEVKIHGVTCKVVRIGDRVFKNGRKLKKVILGKNVTTIGKEAFFNCKKFKMVQLKGKALKTIRTGAFKKTSAKMIVSAKKMSKSQKAKLLKKLKKAGISKRTKVK